MAVDGPVSTRNPVCADIPVELWSCGRHRTWGVDGLLDFGVNEFGFRAGAVNLLCNCAGGKAGDTVLIVGESGSSPYFEPELVQDLAHVSEDLGMQPVCALAEPVASADDFPTRVTKLMNDSDVTVFLSRLGDQVRFLPVPTGGTIVMAYTLTRKHLASAFGTTNYAVTESLLNRLVAVMSAASRYRIQSRNGTDLRSDIRIHDARSDFVPFTLKLFPTMIFPPIGICGLSGTLVIEHFTTSTSTRAYDDSVLMLSTPIRVTVEDGRMVNVTGDPDMVRAFREQCERAARITGGDPFRLNSWHVGVNPFTFFDGDPFDDVERWGTVAFGSPRFTHFHAAGRDPGDLAINLFDASIGFDEDWIWKDGRFAFLDGPDIRAWLDESGQSHLTSSVRHDIGI